jgi:hypothetical protein
MSWMIFAMKDVQTLSFFLFRQVIFMVLVVNGFSVVLGQGSRENQHTDHLKLQVSSSA